MIRLARWEVLLSLVATLAFGWLWGSMSASASPDSGKSVYRLVQGEDPDPYRVVFRCDSWAEDSAAHLRLVDYTSERIVYRCERAGY